VGRGEAAFRGIALRQIARGCEQTWGPCKSEKVGSQMKSWIRVQPLVRSHVTDARAWDAHCSCVLGYAKARALASPGLEHCHLR